MLPCAENEASGSVGGLSPSHPVQSTREQPEMVQAHACRRVCTPLLCILKKGQVRTCLGHSWSSVQTEAAPFTCVLGATCSVTPYCTRRNCVSTCVLSFGSLPQGQTCSGVEQVCQQTLLDLLELPAQGGRERYSSYLCQGEAPRRPGHV